MAERKREFDIGAILALAVGLPLLAGALTGGFGGANIFSSVENLFRQLVQEGKLNYTQSDLQVFTFNTSTNETWEVALPLQFSLVNQTADYEAKFLGKKGTILFVSFNTTTNETNYKIVNFEAYCVIHVSDIGDDGILDIVASDSYCKCTKGQGYIKFESYYQTTTSDLLSTGNIWNPWDVDVKVGDWMKLYTSLDGANWVLRYDNSALSAQTYNISLSDEKSVKFAKGIQSDNINLDSVGGDEAIFLTANWHLLEPNRRYKIVAGSDWQENINYALDFVKYDQDFVNAINMWFKPSNSYKVDLVDNQSYIMQISANANDTMVLIEGNFTTSNLDDIISIILGKECKISVDNALITAKCEQPSDIWVYFKPYNATFSGTVYRYDLSIKDRILGFIKSLLRFDWDTALSYVTGQKTFEKAEVRPISPNYLNLLTKEDANVTITLNDQDTPTILRYADETFGTLFAIKPAVDCLIIPKNSENYAVCGDYFIIGAQNNVVYIMGVNG